MTKHPRLALLERQLTQAVRMAERQKELELAQKKVVPEPAPLDPATLEKSSQVGTSAVRSTDPTADGALVRVGRLPSKC